MLWDAANVLLVTSMSDGHALPAYVLTGERRGEEDDDVRPGRAGGPGPCPPTTTTIIYMAQDACQSDRAACVAPQALASVERRALERGVEDVRERLAPLELLPDKLVGLEVELDRTRSSQNKVMLEKVGRARSQGTRLAPRAIEASCC